MAINALDELEKLHDEVKALQEQVRSLTKPQASNSNFIHIATLFLVIIGVFILYANERHTYTSQKILQSFADTLQLYEAQE